LVKLTKDLREGDPKEIVEYDHNSMSEMGHDVEEEGVHIDFLWRDDDSDNRSKILTNPKAPDEGMNFAEAHLNENLEDIIKLYEEETSE